MSQERPNMKLSNRERRRPSIDVPFLGSSASWQPTPEDGAAAYELLVEILTRTATVDLVEDTGSDRAALTTMHQLADAFREILRKHGPKAAADRSGGAVSTARIAQHILKRKLQPLIMRWDPELARREGDMGAGTRFGPQEWGSWELHRQFREELRQLLLDLHEFVLVLGRAARVTDLTATLVSDFEFEPSPERRLFTTAEVHTGAVVSQPKWWHLRSRPQAPRRHMARWLDPWPLAWSAWYLATAIDTRDKTAAEYRPADAHDDEVWFDYLADMGDAFDPMMEIAWTISRDCLVVGNPAVDSEVASQFLPRGDLLILGGDEVYPYPGQHNYERQLDLPFRSAFETAVGDVDERSLPQVWALPGNHDWMGGLSKWRNRFVDQEQWTGCATPQRDSWFSVQLPHGWWMWGVDTWLDGSVNARQREYFEHAAAELAPGDYVIVCTSVPAWRLHESKPEQLVALDQFIEQTIDARGASARLFLSGDAHVFASYTRRPLRNGCLEYHVTAGGGGGFLHPTHNLAPVVPTGETKPTRQLDLASFVGGNFWPPPHDTHRVIADGWFKTIRDRQSLRALSVIAAVFACYYSILCGLGAAERATVPRRTWETLADVLHDVGSRSARLISGLPEFYVTAVLGLLIVLAARLGSSPNTKEIAVVRFAKRAATAHGLRHLAAFVVVASISINIELRYNWSRWITLPIFSIIAALVSMVLLMRYLARVNRDHRVHDNAAFSFRHLTEGNHFLRCHIDSSGDLHLNLIGIEQLRGGWLDAMATDQPVLPPGAIESEPVQVAELIWHKTLCGPVQKPTSSRSPSEKSARPSGRSSAAAKNPQPTMPSTRTAQPRN